MNEQLKDKVLTSFIGATITEIKDVCDFITNNVENLCVYNPVIKKVSSCDAIFDKVAELDEEENEPITQESISKPVKKIRKSNTKSISGQSWTQKILEVSKKYPKGFTANEVANYLSKTEIESIDYLREICSKICSHHYRSNNFLVKGKKQINFYIYS
jgi:hypothetical protein